MRVPPPIQFMGSYIKKVDSIDTTGPFHHWYAQNAKFYNAYAVVYDGGNDIWAGMAELPAWAVLCCPSSAYLDMHLQCFDRSNISRERSKIRHVSSTKELRTEGSYRNGWSNNHASIFDISCEQSELEGQGTNGLQTLEARA